MRPRTMARLVAAAAREAPAGGDPETLKSAQREVFRAMRPADPRNYVRGQYEGYGSIEGVAEGSTTETYVALRLDIESWRWSGVPFFIRTGRCLPVTQTELSVMQPLIDDPPAPTPIDRARGDQRRPMPWSPSTADGGDRGSHEPDVLRSGAWSLSP